MRTCSACGESYPLTTEFFYRKRVDGLSGWCRDCEKAKAREYQRANKDRKRELALVRYRRNVELVANLRSSPCQDCGLEHTPSINHFHHRDPASKLFKLSDPSTKSEARILAEAAKCDLLCPNCHALRHVRSGNASEADQG